MPKRKRGSRKKRRAKNKYSKSLNKQMHERMQTLNTIGHSRHLAKEQTADGRTAGIYSETTYNNYKQVSVHFVRWLKNSHPKVKHITDLKRHTVIEYLQERERHGLSSNTLSRDLGAVNKLFNLNITKKEAHLAQRSYKKITRSRSEKDYNKQYNPKNYKKQIAVAKAFGIRRESFVTGDYRLKKGSIYQHNGKIYAAVVEKGGKFRNVEARLDMQEQIKQYFHLREQPHLYSEQTFKEAYRIGKLGENLFASYTTKIDNHALRREYAQKKYQEIENKLRDAKQDYYQQYDQRAIAEVSKYLGHNRSRVIVEHYLR